MKHGIKRVIFTGERYDQFPSLIFLAQDISASDIFLPLLGLGIGAG
jgi:hypothetical protein